MSSDFLSGTDTSLLARAVNLYSQSYATGGGPEYGILSQPSQTWWGGWNPGNTGNLRIMSGTKPDNINNLSNSTPPAGTKVIVEILSLSYLNYYSPTGNRWYTDPTSISTIFLEATETGIATWFWICTMSNVSGGTVWHNIVGDVGLLGSGADMEVTNASILAGQYCRVLSLKLSLPVTFYDVSQ